MSIKIAATPVLEGADAAHFLKRMEFWSLNPVTLKEVKINNEVVDKAVEVIRARRSARMKVVENVN